MPVVCEELPPPDPDPPLPPPDEFDVPPVECEWLAAFGFPAGLVFLLVVLLFCFFLVACVEVLDVVEVTAAVVVAAAVDVDFLWLLPHAASAHANNTAAEPAWNRENRMNEI